MKRPVGLILVVVLLVVLAGSSWWWAPRLLDFVGTNNDQIQGLANLVQLVLWAITGLAILLGFRQITGQNEASGERRSAKTHVGGDVHGSNIVTAAGNATAGPVAASTSMSGEGEARTLFVPVLIYVRARPGDPDVDNLEIQQVVERLRDEVGHGASANPAKLRRWLELLQEIAPDVQERVLRVLDDPTAPITEPIRAIAREHRPTGT